MFWLSNAVRHRPGRLVFASVLLLALGVGLGWWLHTATPPQLDASGERAATAETPAAKDARRASTPTTADVNRPGAVRSDTDPDTTAPPWPASLRDSEPDGAITLDAQGRLRPSLEVRRLFDYFLSAIGELELPAIRALLLVHVRGLHGDAVAAEVMALFDRYVDYQQALAAMHAPPGEPLRDRLARVRELRRRLLDGATADAFFGDEERYTEYTLDRRDLLADTTLDETARQQRLHELEARLPDAQRAQMQEANAAVLVDEQNRQFDALRLDPAQRQAEREALFGAEAAQRLAAADAEHAAWEARIAAYVQARNAIRNDAQLDADARARAVDALRARSFDDAERRRISSLEAIDQL